MNDGAVFLSVGWLGNAWDLYFNQFASRAVSIFLAFGPAWAARLAFDPSASGYMTLAHALYFATPLALWLVLRAVEPHRLSSRLYLAIVLALVYFPTELIVGIGLWLIWVALIIGPARSARQAVFTTLLLGVALAFTHPAIALMSLLYLAIGGALSAFGRPVPRLTLTAAAAMSALLLAAYLATSRWLPATNPTVLAALAVNRYDFIDPGWMLTTLVLFPALAAQWLLLLPRYSVRPPALAPFATRRPDRYRARPVVCRRRDRPADLAVGSPHRAVCPGAGPGPRARIAIAMAHPGAAAVDALCRHRCRRCHFLQRRPFPLWPLCRSPPHAGRGRCRGAGVRAVAAALRRAGRRARLFKWALGPDYLRDVVVPTYDWYRVTLAFYSFFRSSRQGVLYHPLGAPGDWLPFECPSVGRALAHARDAQDSMFLTFLADRYCVHQG